MKELDIIFNIDYASIDADTGPLYIDLSKYIQHVCVCDMGQFTRLVAALKEDTVCYIWVHPSYNSTRVGIKKMLSAVEQDSVPELKRLNIQFKRITRSSALANKIDLFVTSEMLDLKKTMKHYTALELCEMLVPEKLVVPVDQIRQRLANSLSEDIEQTNGRLAEIGSHLSNTWTVIQANNWINGLFPAVEEEVKTTFASRYWQFPISGFKRYIGLDQPHQELIDTNVTKVDNIILFDEETHKWQIDMSFFNEVSDRFEGIDEKDFQSKLIIAGCLYVLHEGIHKIHNLDTNTVTGIGNFPRIVEEADYQADLIAMLIYLSFEINKMGNFNSLTVSQIGEKFCAIIRIAIETTFSFNPVGENLKRIQVRRVNRYLIWFWHYFRIKDLMKKENDSVGFLRKVLSVLSVKPSVEVTGPAILSSNSQDRTFYDLNNIKHTEFLGVMLENNEIIRLRPTSDIQFQDLYNGLKESDFEKMSAFLTKLLAHYRSLIGF